MKKLRFLALLMSAMLIISVMTGCEGKKANSSSSQSASTSFKEVNEFGWGVPEKTLKIGLLNAYGDDAPIEEQKAGRENMKKYLLDKFNVQIDEQEVTGDGTEALNLALSSGTYPDVVYGATYNMALKFQNQGKAIELTPYMDTIGKDIKADCKDVYPLLLDDQGKLWFIPTEMGSLMELPDYSAAIRYDEWLAIGSPKIETPDDYYNALKAVLKANPKTPKGEKRYALSLYDFDYPLYLTGYWGFKRGWQIDDDNSFTYWAFTDQGKEMTKWFNQIYRDGNLDPDAFANKFDDWKAKFSAERIAGSIGSWWMCWNAGHEVWQSLDPKTPENKRYVQVGFKAPDAKAAYITGKNKYGSYETIVTDKAKDVENIIRFINFQATERGMALFNWGIPNGIPTYADKSKTLKE